MNNFRLPLLAMVFSLLSGCSIIARPPSAAAFMGSFRDNFSTNTLTLAHYSGDLVHETKENDRESSRHKFDVLEADEWPADISFFHFFNWSYFSLGLGLQSLTLMLQPGFVSEHFGVMSWGSLGLMGGISTIEQMYWGDNWRLGFTQHVSVNGREFYLKDSYCGDGGIFVPPGACSGDPEPVRYTEFGAGAYISYGRFSFEFRYGRDISESRNRYTFSIDWSFYGKGSSPDYSLPPSVY